VFHCIEGRGQALIEDQRLEFQAKDTFVVPSWQVCRLQAQTDCVLFSFSDRPVQRALSMWREALIA
jgi:gentisate 1,2-dioxygenase